MAVYRISVQHEYGFKVDHEGVVLRSAHRGNGHTYRAYVIRSDWQVMDDNDIDLEIETTIGGTNLCLTAASAISEAKEIIRVYTSRNGISGYINIED